MKNKAIKIAESFLRPARSFGQTQRFIAESDIPKMVDQICDRSIGANKDKIIEILEDHLEWLHDNEIIFKSDIELIATRIDSLCSEKVPDLSKLDKANMDEFIKEFVEMTAKNVLSVFVALGLKTHLEATVVNDADGNTYKLSFRNINSLCSGGVSDEDRLLHFYDYIEQHTPDRIPKDIRKSMVKRYVKNYPITKGAKRVSEERIEEAFSLHSDKLYRVMDFAHFKAALKELNQ